MSNNHQLLHPGLKTSFHSMYEQLSFKVCFKSYDRWHGCKRTGDYLIGEIKDIRNKQPENNFKSEIRNSPRVALNVDDIVKKKKTKPNSLSPQYSRFFRLLVPDEPKQMSLDPAVSVHWVERWAGTRTAETKLILKHLLLLFKAALGCSRRLFRKTSCSLWWLSRFTSYFTGF